ncbi:MAG TPA: hypothetical protein VND23_06105, partial [Acidimicrobiales bacterium]|nr:hypothetical protein [Acidimicrobiales bacterium]
SDGFRAVRALLAGRYRSTAAHPRRGRTATSAGVPGHAALLRSPRAAGARAQVPPALAGGRWSLLPSTVPSDYAPDELAEALAAQLLTRWGVVFRELAAREALGLPWRDVLWALRRLEARGLARGGRFVAGVTGEQFGLPDAIDAVRRTAASTSDGVIVRLSAADPLNLTGMLLPGPRVPAVRGREIVLCDGAVLSSEETGARRPRAVPGAAAS